MINSETLYIVRGRYTDGTEDYYFALTQPTDTPDKARNDFWRVQKIVREAFSATVEAVTVEEANELLQNRDK